MLLHLVLAGPFLLTPGFPSEFLLGFLPEFLSSGVLVACGDEGLLLSRSMLGNLSSWLRFGLASSAALALATGTSLQSFLALFLAVPNHLLDPLVFLCGRGSGFLLRSCSTGEGARLTKSHQL